MNIAIDGMDADELQRVVWAVAESQNLGMANGILFMWVITERPSDAPRHYVARAHAIKDGKDILTHSVIFCRELKPLEAVFEIAGLVKLARHESDAKHIVEVWT